MNGRDARIFSAAEELAEGPASVARLGKALLLCRNAGIRAHAASALGESGCLSAYAWLRKALWDRDEEVRARVVDAVGRLRIAQSAGELAAVFAYASPRVRRLIVRAARRIGWAAEFSGLLRIAEDDRDRGVRALARAARTRSAAGRGA